MAVVAPFRVLKAAQRGGRSRRSRNLPLVFLVGSLMVLAAAQLLSAGVKHSPLLLSPCSHSASSACSLDAGPGLDAVAFICVGPSCDADLLCSSALSLRGVASWRGPTFVLTDNPPSRLQQCARKLSLSLLPVPSPSVAMQFKNLKRQLFKHLPPSLSRVLYIDSDNLPVGCLHSFLQSILLSMHNKNNEYAPIAMFPDNACTTCNRLNGGFMFMHLGSHAANCLDEWTELSSSNNMTAFTKDQDALDMLLKSHRSACSHAIAKLPWQRVAYMDSALWPGRLRALVTRPHFLHFTKGIRASTRWPHIMQHINRELEPYADTAQENARFALESCAR